MQFEEEIKKAEEEIKKTPYHKGTEHYIGKLRARIARLKDRIYESASKKGGGGGGYGIKKSGDATVVLVGPPSVGKSTLLNRLTNANSPVASYAFTTTSVVPGMMFYKGAYIQIFDIPGLIEGASLGKGRGKEVISVARGADLIIIMTDMAREGLIDKIKAELETSGIRLNKARPKVKVEKKDSGGIDIHIPSSTKLSAATVKEIAEEFGLRNAEITVQQNLNLEELIDAFSTSRVYVPAIFVVNKADSAKFKGNEESIYISAQKGINIDFLQEKIWDKLGLTKVFLSDGDRLIVTSEYTLSDLAEKIGEDFAKGVKSVKIWGPGAKFPGQEVSLSTHVREGMKVKFL